MLILARPGLTRVYAVDEKFQADQPHVLSSVSVIIATRLEISAEPARV